jgi:preprotein translocase subunit SecA
MPMDDNRARGRYDRKREQEEEHRKQLPTEEEPALPPPVEPVHVDKEPGRNDPCPCGSGKKYKKCCGAKKEKKGK